MVTTSDLPGLGAQDVTARRLVNSRFPPIRLFDDVASEEDFEAIYAVQALTNPRLRAEAGDITHIEPGEIPFGIRGCSYAVAPFTHINPDGSRFSDGHFGVLYLADTVDPALAEVCHHQEAYWRRVPDLHYDRFVMRDLAYRFSEQGILDGLTVHEDDPIYNPDDYSASRPLGLALRNAGVPGLRYRSVRAPGHTCWALFTPRPVGDVVQCGHYELIWQAGKLAANRLSAV